MVMMASNKYRNCQDYISAFVGEKIIKEMGKKIKKAELNEEFKLWYCSSNMGSRNNSPKASEIHDYLDKKFGLNKNGIWSNVKIADNTPVDDVVALSEL